MSEKKGLTRRKVIRSGLIGGAGLAAVAALAGCGETQIVEKEVVRVVTQEVPVEKVVTQVVEKERVVEVEKVVTQEVEVAVEVEKVVTQRVEVEKVVTKIVEVEKPVVEKASLRLASYVWGDRVVAEYARNISDWEAKSGHNVQFEYSNYNGHLQRLATQIAAGNPPDVAMSVPDVIPNWVAAGIIVELTEYLKVSTFDINEWYPEVWQGLRDVSQTKVYAVPVTWDGDLTYFNKELFDAAGVEYPAADGNWTYEDMIEKALQLNQFDGDRQTQWGAMNGFVAGFDWPFGAGHYKFDEDQFYNECITYKQGYTDAMQLVHDFVYEYSIWPKPGAAPSGNIFKAGLVGMWATGGSWNIQGLQDSPPPFAWDLTMPPLNTESGRRPSGGQANNFEMFTATKYPDQAWELMHDLALTDHGQATLGVALETPAKKAAAEGAYAEQVLSAADNGLVTLEVLDKWTKAFQNGYLLWDVYVGELIQFTDQMLSNDITPVEMGQMYADSMNAAIEEQRAKRPYS